MECLYYEDDFISPELEKSLFDFFYNQPSKPALTSGRLMQAYGYGYNKGDYGLTLHKLDPIPQITNEMVSRIQQKLIDLHLTNQTINQLTVNNYNPSSSIDAHFDHKTRFGDVIVGVSLGSGCLMHFKNYHNKNNYFSHYLKPRSLYIMFGDLRYNWTHQIKPATHDCVDGLMIPRSNRISLTFRSAILI